AAQPPVAVLLVAAVIASRRVHLPAVGVSPASSTMIVVAWAPAEAASTSAGAVRRARLTRADAFMVFSQSLANNCEKRGWSRTGQLSVRIFRLISVQQK